jgi:hypothetical protein
MALYVIDELDQFNCYIKRLHSVRLWSLFICGEGASPIQSRFVGLDGGTK